MQTKFITKVFPSGQNRLQVQLQQSIDCILIPCYQLADTGKVILPKSLAQLDIVLDGLIQSVCNQKDFLGKVGEVLLINRQKSWLSVGLAAERVMLVGLGERDISAGVQPTQKYLQDYVKASRTAIRNLLGTRSTSVLWLLDQDELGKPSPSHDALISQTIQLIEEQSYRFGLACPNLKSKPNDQPVSLKSVMFATTDKNDKAIKEVVRCSVAVAAGITLAKDLGNLPPNICTPTYLAKTAQSLSKLNIQVKILERKDLERLGMGAFLAVTNGSDTPPKLIVMEYRGGLAKEAPIALVGKGITFDTGGISLKPGEAMDEMKFDMCGAASVLGTMHAVAQMKLRKNVIGIIPACENMPSGKATRPGDIVVTMSGQTVEILNTDAEGRLILCDALTYVKQFKPATVIDIATLTGACVIALGSVHSGLFSKNADLTKRLVDAGKHALDTVWPMPLDDQYQEQLKSNFADFANIGGRPAGSITAACFLSRFTQDYDWAHLDIAGTAWKSGVAKGSTGRPVPLLAEFLMQSVGPNAKS